MALESLYVIQVWHDGKGWLPDRLLVFKRRRSARQEIARRRAEGSDRLMRPMQYVPNPRARA